MKISMSKAILIGSVLIALAIWFRADAHLFSTEAKADVAGMDAYDLMSDYDFKRVVQSIIENCDVDVSVDVGVTGDDSDGYCHFVNAYADAEISC